MAIYRTYSAAVPTTAAMVSIATGTTIKTHMQITAPATRELTIIGWGVAFEATPTVFVKAELINTTTVAGTGMTAVVPTVILGSAASLATAGWGPSAEGSVAATCEVYDAPILLTNLYVREWSLGREPNVAASNVIRVRLTTSVTINALCWIDHSES